MLELARDALVRDWVRSAAARALGQLGRAQEAAEVLLELARDADVDVEGRSTAFQSLKQLVGGATD